MSLINREDLIAEYDRVHVGAPGGARKLMVDAPEVVSEIIMCKDCKHRLSSLYCEAWNNSPGFPCIGDEMFCSMAERRTND